MSGENKKGALDISTLYQVAADRLNVMHQQAQMAISICSVSIMAFGATIGAVFASMDNASDMYKIYAVIFIIIISSFAVVVSFVCREILYRSAEVCRQYENKLKEYECSNSILIKPHNDFQNIWNNVFNKYEPYKMMCWLMVFSICLYVLIIIVATYNIYINYI